MPLTSWLAAPDGRYWIDVTLGNGTCHVMIDLGLVDPLDRVGFELAPYLGVFCKFGRQAVENPLGL